MEIPNIKALELSFAQDLTWSKEILQDMHPIDMVKQIEKACEIIENFITPWKIKSRKAFSQVKWLNLMYAVETIFGSWSNTFNKNLREKIKFYKEFEDKKELTDIDKNLLEKYRLVYAFWWNSYHLFDEVLKKRTGIAGRISKKHIMKGRKTLKGCIDGSIEMDQVHENFKRLINSLNNDDFSSVIKKEE